MILFNLYNLKIVIISLNYFVCKQLISSLVFQDFFVDDHWNKLPLAWRNAFYNMNPQALGDIMNGKLSNCVLPLSFLALVKTVDVLSIPRTGKKLCNINHEVTMPNDSCGGHPRLKNLFLKHVKLKKRHEISMMAEVVQNTAAQTSCNGVLDFGSGLGHLVRMLAYKFDLSAGGIECQSQLTEEARSVQLVCIFAIKMTCIIYLHTP